MGMKIKHESRARTLFRKIFRLSKKEKHLKHTKTDEDLGSRVSIDSVNPEPKQTHVDNEKKNKQKTGSYGEDYLDRLKSDNNVKNIQAGKKTKEKTKKVKVTNDTDGKAKKRKKYKTLSEEVTNSAHSLDKNRNKDENSANDNDESNRSKVDVELCNIGEDELIEVDLNLVLTSLAKLTSTNSEIRDNVSNERRLFTEISVESHDSVDSKNNSIMHVEHFSGINEKNIPDITCNGSKVESEIMKEKIVVENKNKSDTGLSKNKKKRRRKKKKGYESIEEESYQSIELIVSKTREELPPLQCSVQTTSNVNNSSKKKSKRWRKQKQQKGNYLKIEENTVDIVVESVPGEDEFAEKAIEGVQVQPRRKLKKKRNVRQPEDDLEDVSHDQLRNRKHQELSANYVITDLESTVDSAQEEPKSKKRFRRRKLKIKFNKDKGNLKVTRYDELKDDIQSENSVEMTPETKHLTAKEVRRRMWKACKVGWKYMKAGLVYYTRAPSVVPNINPILQRYDEYGAVPSTSRSPY